MQRVEAIPYGRPRWIPSPRLLIGITVGIVLAWLMSAKFGLSGPLSIILVTQIFFFILLFRRPIWAMASLIVGQFTVASYMINLPGGLEISIRFLWTLMTLLLLVPILHKRRGIKLGKMARRVTIPAILFFVFATFSNIVNAGLADTFVYLRIAASALVILILLPASIKNERDIKIFSMVAVVVASASSLVAIMQHYQRIGLPVLTVYPDTNVLSRQPGLTEGPVSLAYVLPVIIIPVLAMYFARGVSSRKRMLLVISSVVMMAALYFTYTRSGVYAIALGALVLLILLKGKPKKELFLVLIILAAGFQYYTEIKQNRYSLGITEESSGAIRLVLWEAGLRIAKDYPFWGIGQDRFTQMSQSYSSVVSAANMQRFNVGSSLGAQKPHNDFIRVWLSFGTPAFLALLWLFVSIFRNFYFACRGSPTRFQKAFAIGCSGAMAAYIVNAFTHNVMDSIFILWIFGGLSIACVKLAQQQKPQAVKELR